MPATPDLYHSLGDNLQLWRYLPQEPPGVIFDPAGDTATITIVSHATAEQGTYPADVVDGGFEFPPASATVIDQAGPYDVRWTVTSDEGGQLTFPNFIPLLLWVTD